MELSEHTVKNYLFRIFDKLGVSTRAELVLYAVSHVAMPRDMSANTTQCEAAIAAGDLQCDVECCPLSQLRLGKERHANECDLSGCELAYIRLAIAEATSAVLHDRSSAALSQLEHRIPPDRLMDLKRDAAQRVRKALEAIVKSDDEKIRRVSGKVA